MDCGDCGSCPFGCRRGAKQSGIRAHLAEAVRSGAEVLDRARVRSLLPGTRRRRGRRRRDARAGCARRAARRAGAAPSGSRPARSSSPPARCAARPSCRPRASAHPAIGRHLRIHPVPVDRRAHGRPGRHVARHDAGGPVDAVRGRRGGPAAVRHRVGARPPRAPRARAALGRRRGPRRAHGAGRGYFAPLIAITRDGGEGRTRLTRAGRVRIDYRLDASGRRPLRHALVSMARLARAGGAAEILAVGHAPPAARVRGTDGGDGRRGPSLRRVRGDARADGLQPRTVGRSPRPTRWARVADGRRCRQPTPPTRAAGSARDSRGSIVPGLYVADTLDVPDRDRRQSDGRRHGDGAPGQPDGARGGAAGLTAAAAGAVSARWRVRGLGAGERATGGDDDRDRGEDDDRGDDASER